MAKKHFIAGPGKALLIRGDELIGVATTATEAALNVAIDATEIRAGQGNLLFGKYFHDSSMSLELTDAMFNIDYFAASLGASVESGGISIKEESLTISGDKVTASNDPVALNGSVIGWYKKPEAENWQVATFNSGTKELPIAGGLTGNVCVKYFYNNADGKSIKIYADYVPSELHVVLINELFAGEQADLEHSSRYGRVITDIPRLQMNGSQNLALSATGAATTSLSGTALAITSNTVCEDTPYYGTMTQEIYGAHWQDDVIALAVENGEITASGAILNVRAVFGGAINSKRVENTALSFTATSGITVSEAGAVTGSGTGTVTIKLKKPTGSGTIDGLEAFVSVNI